MIHPDQRGFVPGRSIHEANRLIQDIIDYANMRNDNGSIIFLDQEKAFDRVEWEWLDACLIKYNFGNEFRSWVNMLLKDAKTCIKTNGHISNYFKITRSARQGCPISPLLYILQIEPLACTLRKDNEVKGIKLPNNSEVKVSMLADDTQLFLKDELSIINSMNILSTFEEASGSKINLRKTIGIYIGGWKNKNPEYTNITWSKTCVKTLGIYHGNIVDNDAIWKEKLDKIKSSLQIWKTRNLTLKGKSLIIQSLIISKIGFELEAKGIPEKYIKEINKLIWSFVWDGKKEQVSRKTMMRNLNCGGMNIIDINSFVLSVHIKTMYKIIHSQSDSWNAIGKHFFNVL